MTNASICACGMFPPKETRRKNNRETCKQTLLAATFLDPKRDCDENVRLQKSEREYRIPHDTTIFGGKTQENQSTWQHWKKQLQVPVT